MSQHNRPNPFAFRGPITLESLPDLFSHHRALTGGWGMDTSGGDGDGSGDGKPPEGDGKPAGDGKPKPGDETGPKFTQADIDRVVTERMAAEKRRHDRELEQAREDAGKSDTQRIEAERDRYKTQAEQAAQKAAPKVAQALAQVAAIAAGGRADRAAAIVRVADLDGVAKFDGDDFTIDESRLTEAIGKVLTEYPEWKGEAPKPDDEGKGDEGDGKPKHSDSSGGDLNGGRSGELTLDTFKGMTMTERGKLASEKPDEYRRLADAEIDANRKHSSRR